MFDSTTSSARSASVNQQGGRPTAGTALIVEDHRDFRELLSLVLKRLGYTVLEANNALDALQLAAREQLDLIVTDLGLPQMDGLEFIQLVRDLKKNEPDLKIVMLTAYDTHGRINNDAGYDYLLSKPVDLDKLESVIRSLQSQQQAKFNKYGTPSCSTRRRDMPDSYKNVTLH